MSTPSIPSELSKLEIVIEKGKVTFLEVGTALFEIRDRKLYGKDYKTFEDYCQERWGWSRQRSAQLINSALAVQGLATNLSTMVDSERAAREISKIPQSRRADVVAKAARNGTVTARSIQEAAAPQPRINPDIYTSRPTTSQIKPQIELDKTGWPIPEKLLPIWNRMQEIQDLITHLSRVKAALEHAQSDKDIMFVEVNFSSAIADLKNAFTTINRAKPYAVCTSCQGRVPEKCTLCHGKGFISEFRWKTAVPEEIKTLRAKATK